MHFARRNRKTALGVDRTTKAAMRVMQLSVTMAAMTYAADAYAEEHMADTAVAIVLPAMVSEASVPMAAQAVSVSAPLIAAADVHVEPSPAEALAPRTDVVAVSDGAIHPHTYTLPVDNAAISQWSMASAGRANTGLARLASASWEADLYGRSEQALYGLLDTGDAQMNAMVYGPSDPSAQGFGGTLDDRDARYNTIGGQIGAVKWEVLGVTAYITATNLSKIINVGGRGFSFQDEGWFGRDTNNLGIDKLAHAYNSYLFSEIFYHRIRHRVGDRPNVALTGALLGWGVQFFGEIWDGFKTTSGFSLQDLITNTAGAGFSYLRNVVPGMREKVDFRVLIMPNSDIYSFNGKRHYEQQRFMLAFTLAGFRQFENTPLRFLELHVGYHATGFTPEQVANGDRLRRHVFVGVGINLNELLFGSRPRSGAARAASAVFDYLQIPYTAVHF